MKPEILSPAGSPEAFFAALGAGADAIYVGCPSFNARINAKNFDRASLTEAIRYAHALGTKVYVTLNTLLLDREIKDFLAEAKFCYRAGVDAAIVADLGAAKLIKKHIPNMPIHASTQLSGHNSICAKELEKLGFERMVCAREISKESLKRLIDESPIEIEAFVHGALCVSHSGQCLFSSMVGARSGNRGLCAQPCRLPYKVQGAKGEVYPLSLKDLSLARHVRELIDMGVASFKIEGRMKSPEYVGGVTSVFRRLVDENRGATDDEMRYLAELFSRGGEFTDGYYSKNINSSMLGIRTDKEKNASRELYSTSSSEKRKAKIDMSAKFVLGEPISLEITLGKKRARSVGQSPEKAINAPLSRENVIKNLTKLGNTPFELGNLDIELDEGVIVPVSAINKLRRDAVEAILATGDPDFKLVGEYVAKKNSYPRPKEIKKVARFISEDQISESAVKYFDILYLPLEKIALNPDISDTVPVEKLGAILPPVIFDTEADEVRAMLKMAKNVGVSHLLVGNIGHLSFAREFCMIPHGDFRLNVMNSESYDGIISLGFEDVILSPELTVAQIRDISAQKSAIVYGRIPLMTLEKCVAKEISSCKSCMENSVFLTDRTGARFGVVREWKHRSVIYNSVPTYVADTQSELFGAGVGEWVFIFSDEGKKEVDLVISAYKNKSRANFAVRRIGAGLKAQSVDAKTEV